MTDRDLDETTVLLTGGTSGIGRVAAERLADRGAKVGIVGRSKDRGEAIAADNDRIRFHRADLSTFDAVRSLAERIKESYEGLDVLAHNAGVSMADRTETGDGIEYTVAVNHLAPYLLTHELLDLVRAGDGGRLVVTASGIHYRGTLDFDDLEFESEYDALDAYARSKLANVAFTIELAERLGDAVTANCFHPGFVPSTGLFRNARLHIRIGMRIASLVPGVGTSPETGANRLVRLATDPRYEQRSGEYVGGSGPESPADEATDPDVRDQLWRVSADYVDVDPDWP